jgi:ribosomal protein L37AE/L43A
MDIAMNYNNIYKGSSNMDNMAKKTLKCPKCKYEWKSRTKMYWVTCPRCMLKFKVNGKENDTK